MARGLGLGTVWLAVALLGCGSSEPTQSEVRDDGAVCLRLLEDGTVTATVTFRTCLTSCDRALSASCAVEVDGATLRFSSNGRSERTTGDSCTGACVKPTATCATTEKVAPGTHSIVHGQDTATITLGTRTVCLFAD